MHEYVYSQRTAATTVQCTTNKTETGREYKQTFCVFIEMKFFAVIFLVTLLMMAATLIQEVSARECC